MAWFGDSMADPLAAVRAAHFCATALTSGSLMFRSFVGRPAARSLRTAEMAIDAQASRLAAIGLVVAVATGLLWFALTAAQMSGLSLRDALRADILRTVLTETQFGLLSEIRFGLAIVLALCLMLERKTATRLPALAAAVGFTGAIAWMGHAGSTFGNEGLLHIVADVLHLVAAAAWVGGLVPFALLLWASWRYHRAAWAEVTYRATTRFSALGLISVAVLLLSGLINAWFLVGSFRALTITAYGLLLVVKLCLFALMLLLAAVNRYRLTPELSRSSADHPRSSALGRLTRNCALEIILGVLIFSVVGLLGTLHPAIHFIGE